MHHPEMSIFVPDSDISSEKMNIRHHFDDVTLAVKNIKYHIAILFLTTPAISHAGGILTNTNQHIHFLRMVARGASTDIDAVYSNPAGLGWYRHDGWSLSLNAQNVAQHRDIEARYTVNDYTGTLKEPRGGIGTETFSHRYGGRASAPAVPSIFAVFHGGRWTASGSFAIVGGGGKASFDEGLPMFESAIRFGLTNNSALSALKEAVGSQSVTELYDIASAMNGKQYIYGLQLGLTYRINDFLSVFAGGRMNYFDGNYEGYADAVLKEHYQPYFQAATGRTDRSLYHMELDCDQRGWGLTPIVGLSIRRRRWTLGIKYEFMTALNLENKTRRNSDPTGTLAAFAHGVNTPNDVPALLTAALGCEVLPTLRAAVEYHHFYDRRAGMADDKQKALRHGTNEYAAGVEWDATPWATISLGGQRTDYGLTGDFQYDTSFSCDSYSLGFGASLHLSKRFDINVAYFQTFYSDYTKPYINRQTTAAGTVTAVSGTNVYSRTNKVFGIGIDYRF